MRIAVFFALLILCFSPPGQAAPGRVSVGSPLPAFTLRDTGGHPHSLVEFQSRPVTLYFFCGCGPCHDCARFWAQVQQNGELGPQKPSTVIVFTGDQTAAMAFVRETGLDPAQTLLLTDPDGSVTEKYHVLQCPRVFVAAPRGKLIYSSPDAPAPRLPAALVSRALTAWRRLSPIPPRKQANL